jgi:hypothetical protein
MGKKLFLKNDVGNMLTIETVDFEGGYATFLRRRKGRRLIKLAVYTNELDAREGHLHWIMKDWTNKPTLVIRG